MQVNRATFLPLLAPARPGALGAPDPAAVRDEYCGDLNVVYTFGPPFGRRVVTHIDLEQMELPPPMLRRTALEQLNHLAGRATFHGKAPSLMLSFEGLESSLLLASEFWTRLQNAVPGEIVVGVPARDVVIVTGSQSLPGLEKVRRAVDRVFFAGDENLLTRLLLVRRGGGWEPFDRPVRAGSRPPVAAAHRHGPNQQPRQYQEHPSWPAERIPVAAMGPLAQAMPVGRPPHAGPTGPAPMPAPSSMPPGQTPLMGSMASAKTGGQTPLPGQMTPGQMPSGQMPSGQMAPGPYSVDPARVADVAPFSAVPYSAVPYSGVPSSGVPYSGSPYSGAFQPDSPYAGPPPHSVAPQSAMPYSSMPNQPVARSRGARAAHQGRPPASSFYPAQGPYASAGAGYTGAFPMDHTYGGQAGNSPYPPSGAQPFVQARRPYAAPQEQQPYEQQPYEQQPYEQQPYEQQPYEQQPYEQQPYEQQQYEASSRPADGRDAELPGRGQVYPASWGSAPDASTARPAWDGRTGARARFSR